MIRNSQDKISKFTDMKKKDISYKVKDKIFLLIKNIDIITSLKKLNNKIINLFKITQVIEGSYKLNLSKLIVRK